MFKIDKNVPIPVTHARAPHMMATITMEVGDSFLIEKEKLVQIRQIARKHGIKILTRSVDQYVQRVWRVK